MTHALSRRLAAEFLGTFWLVVGGCGAAVLAAGLLPNGTTQIAIGYTGVALAFGLTVLTGAYAFGAISGAHFNPAVTVGLWAARRFPARDVLPYVIVQVVGAIAAAGVLYVIASGSATFKIENGFATNGYGQFSPQGYSLLACIVCELVMTFMFVMVILGATDERAPGGFAPLAIGLALTIIHLVSIPVTNTSVNPARSTGPALFAGGTALAQLWMFWLVPLAGGALAGILYPRAFGAAGIAPEKPAVGAAGRPG